MSHSLTENGFWFNEFSFPIDFQRSVLLGGKGSFLNVTYLEQQHVICIFSYNKKSENENVVQDMQAVNYLLLISFSPHCRLAEICAYPALLSLILPITQTSLTSGTVLFWN